MLALRHFITLICFRIRLDLNRVMAYTYDRLNINNELRLFDSIKKVSPGGTLTNNLALNMHIFVENISLFFPEGPHPSVPSIKINDP